MATTFCPSMGYNFGCYKVSDSLFDSRGGFFGVKLYDEDVADFDVLREVVMASVFGFLYMGPNTTEPSMCGGDAALFQITLTTYYYHYCY